MDPTTPTAPGLPEIVQEYDEAPYHWIRYRMYENVTDVVEPAARIRLSQWRQARPKEQIELRAEALRRDVRRNNHLHLTRAEALRNIYLDPPTTGDDNDRDGGF